VSLRALIFDFDGTLVDTETPEVEVWREVFAENGATYPDEYWINAIGRGADQIEETPRMLMERLFEGEIDLDRIDEDRHARVMARIEAQPVRAGALDLLQEARQAGLKVGVASSSKHRWVDTHLQRLGIFDHFDEIVCADDVARAKPFPDLYLAACDRLGVTVSEAVAIEDSPNGVAAAREAGVFVVAFPNPVTSQLDLSHADLVSPGLPSLSEIRKLLRGGP